MSGENAPPVRQEGTGPEGSPGQAQHGGGSPGQLPGGDSSGSVPLGGGASPATGATATAASPAPAGSLSAVMQLEVPVSIELGRTRMAVEDVLALGRGSVVQLDRLVGQPVEVFVSDKPFATGEVVVMGDKFGVRIIRIRDAAGAGGVGP